LLNAVKHGQPAVAQFLKSRTVHAKMGHVRFTLGGVCHPYARIANVCAKYKVPIFSHYGNMKGNDKCTKIRKITHYKVCNGKIIFKNTQGHQYLIDHISLTISGL